MQYLKKEKTEESGEAVIRVADHDVSMFVEVGYVPATRAEWEAVQSDEVKEAIARGEYADEEAPAAEPAPVPEEPVAAPAPEPQPEPAPAE